MSEYGIDPELMPTSKPRVVVYVDEELKKDLEKLAEARDRTVSNFVLTLIKSAISEAVEDGLIDSPSSSQPKVS